MPGDGKAKPGAPAVAVARGLKTQERLEDAFALGRGDAGPAIIDQHDGLAPDLRQRNLRRTTVFHRVVQEVADDARERGRLAPDLDRGRRQVARDSMTGGAALGAFAADGLDEIDALATAAE